MPSNYGDGRWGRWTDDLLDEIRAKIDIGAVIGEYVPLKKRGANLLGLCPFHQEKTPSFTVSPDKQMFYCFGCQTGGNVFSFLVKREGLSFTEAVEQLAARAGVVLPERTSGPENAAAREAGERRKRETDLLYRVLDFTSRYYTQALSRSPAGEKVRAYLAQRGVGAETVTSFRLGYSLESWTALVKTLTAKGVSETVLEQAGLAVRSKDRLYDRFRNRLMFTIADHRGRPIGFGARALSEADEPKYLNSPETPLFSKGRGLYALHLAAGAIRRQGLAIVVEGYMDAIACHEHGFDFTVASMGTAFTGEQARLLRRFTGTVVTAFDADAGGTQATLRGLEVLTASGFKVKVAEMPGGKDPDEGLRASGGREAFARAVAEALPLAEYCFRLALRSHDTGTIEGRVGAVSEILPVLAGIDNPLERQEYIRDFARRLPVPEEALRLELGRYLRASVDPREGRRREGVRDPIRRLRGESRDATASPGRSETSSGRVRLGGDAGSRARRVLDAERTLLGFLAGPEEGLQQALTRLLDAADWCSKLRTGTPSAADEVAASAEPGPPEAPPETPGPPEAGDADPSLDEEAWTPGEGGEEDLGEMASDPLSESLAEPLAEPLTGSEMAVLDWFQDPLHSRIARAILTLIREGPIDVARLVDHLAEDEVGARGNGTGARDERAAVGEGETGAAAGNGRGPSQAAAEVVARILFEIQTLFDQPEQAIRDCIGVLKEHKLNSRIEQLHRRIEDLERAGAQVEREYAELIRELIDLERHTDGAAGHWKVPGD
jgi:DNA primase